MADEEKKEEAAPPPAEGEAKKEAKPSLIKKLLPKILMPMIALVGMGAGAGLMILMKKDHAPPVEAQAAEEAKEGEAKEEDKHAKKDGEEADEDKHDEKEKDEHAKDEHAKGEEKEGDEKDAHGEEAAPAEGGEKKDAHGGEAAGAGAGAGAGALMVKFDPLVVNIAEKNSIHYLKLQLELQVNDEAAILEIDQNKAQIRDRLVFIFSDSSLREVLSTGGKALLKEDIQVALNKILTKGKVTNVFFTDFTVQ